MSDIFISYAKEDRERILSLVHALEKTGWSIFWDRVIPISKTWQTVIGEEIDNCRCMIVAWSRTSIKSEWVYEEAGEGKRRHILFPVLIDDINPPIGFRSIQSGNLISWNDEKESTVLNKLIRDLSELLGEPPANIDAKRNAADDKHQREEADSERKGKEQERKKVDKAKCIVKQKVEDKLLYAADQGNIYNKPQKVPVANLPSHPTGNAIIDHAINKKQLENGFKEEDLSSLHELNLSDTDIADDDLEYLQSLRGLRVLNLGGTNISDDGLKYLIPLDGLQNLILSITDITDEGLKHLKSLTNLRKLWLMDTRINGEGLKFIQALSIKELYLYKTNISDLGMKELQYLTSLKVLYLSNTKITDEGLKFLQPLKGLEELRLTDTNITDEGLKYLHPLSNLQVLYLGGSKITDKGLKHLKKLANLRYLLLLGTEVSDNGCAQLKKVLSSLSLATV